MSNDGLHKEEQVFFPPLLSKTILGYPKFEFCQKMENRRLLFSDFSTKIQIKISQKEPITGF